MGWVTLRARRPAQARAASRTPPALGPNLAHATKATKPTSNVPPACKPGLEFFRMELLSTCRKYGDRKHVLNQHIKLIRNE